MKTQCEECRQLLSEKHWTQIPAGYGTDVKKAQPPGVNREMLLCQGHRTEVFAYPVSPFGPQPGQEI